MRGVRSAVGWGSGLSSGQRFDPSGLLHPMFVRLTLAGGLLLSAALQWPSRPLGRPAGTGWGVRREKRLAGRRSG
eukprot:7692145-Alexandrium_andersonii.AAC.1